MDVVKSLQDTKRYFGVIHSSKCNAPINLKPAGGGGEAGHGVGI